VAQLQDDLAPARAGLIREIRQSFGLMGLMAGMLACYVGLGLLAVRVFG
jgi:hypothetical protein